MPDAHDDDVLWRVADGVATITLNRPERMNVWTWPMHSTFFELVDRADDDPEVRAVVITGSGRGFCPGMDMEFLAETSKAAGEIVARRPLTDLGVLRKPVVAAINGACAGIGLVVALLSDVRFVASGVRMTTSFTRRGLPAEFGASWLLPRLVGVGNAMDLLLSGRVIDAQEALDLGLVNRVVSGGGAVPGRGRVRTGPRGELLAGRDGGDQGAGRGRLAPHAGGVAGGGDRDGGGARAPGRLP